MVEATHPPPTSISLSVLPEQLDKLHSLQRELPEMRKWKKEKENSPPITFFKKIWNLCSVANGSALDSLMYDYKFIWVLSQEERITGLENNDVPKSVGQAGHVGGGVGGRWWWGWGVGGVSFGQERELWGGGKEGKHCGPTLISRRVR